MSTDKQKTGDGRNGGDLLQHPDYLATLQNLLPAVLVEFDRGAVLVATDSVRNQLRKLFEERASSVDGRKVCRRLLEYPGPLSSLPQCRHRAPGGWLHAGLLASVHSLHKLRNEVAHSGARFRMNEEAERIRNICAFGEQLPWVVNQVATRFLAQTPLRSGVFVVSLQPDSTERIEKEVESAQPRRFSEWVAED